MRVLKAFFIASRVDNTHIPNTRTRLERFGSTASSRVELRYNLPFLTVSK